MNSTGNNYAQYASAAESYSTVAGSTQSQQWGISQQQGNMGWSGQQQRTPSMAAMNMNTSQSGVGSAQMSMGMNPSQMGMGTNTSQTGMGMNTAQSGTMGMGMNASSMPMNSSSMSGTMSQQSGSGKWMGMQGGYNMNQGTSYPSAGGNSMTGWNSGSGYDQGWSSNQFHQGIDMSGRGSNFGYQQTGGAHNNNNNSFSGTNNSFSGGNVNMGNQQGYSGPQGCQTGMPAYEQIDAYQTNACPRPMQTQGQGDTGGRGFQGNQGRGSGSRGQGYEGNAVQNFQGNKGPGTQGSGGQGFQNRGMSFQPSAGMNEQMDQFYAAIDMADDQSDASSSVQAGEQGGIGEKLLNICSQPVGKGKSNLGMGSMCQATFQAISSSGTIIMPFEEGASTQKKLSKKQKQQEGQKGQQQWPSEEEKKGWRMSDEFADEDTDYCRLCNMYFTSAPMYSLHVRGASHAQRLLAVDAGKERKELVNPCIISGKNYTQTEPQNRSLEEMRQPDHGALITKKTVQKGRGTLPVPVAGTYCHVCLIDLRTEDALRKHVMTGQKHLMTVKAMQEGSAPPLKIQRRQQQKASESAKGIVPSQFDKYFRKIPRNDPVVGLQYIIECGFSKKKEVLWCYLCDFTGKRYAMKDHVLCARHRLSVVKTHDIELWQELLQIADPVKKAAEICNHCMVIQAKFGMGVAEYQSRWSIKQLKAAMKKSMMNQVIQDEPLYLTPEERVAGSSGMIGAERLHGPDTNAKVPKQARPTQFQMSEAERKMAIESLKRTLLADFRRRNIESEMANKILESRLELLFEYEKRGVSFVVARERVIEEEERWNLLLEFERQSLPFEEAEARIDHRFELLKLYEKNGMPSEEARRKVLDDEVIHDFRDEFVQLGLPKLQARKQAEKRLWMLEHLHYQGLQPEEASQCVIAVERELKRSVTLMLDEEKQGNRSMDSVARWMVVGEEVDDYIIKMCQALGLTDKQRDTMLSIARFALDAYRKEHIPPEEAKCRILVDNLPVPSKIPEDVAPAEQSSSPVSAACDPGSQADIMARVQQFVSKLQTVAKIVTEQITENTASSSSTLEQEKTTEEQLMEYDKQSRLEIQNLLSDMLKMSIPADEARKRLVALYKQHESLRDNLFPAITGKRPRKASSTHDSKDGDKKSTSASNSEPAKEQCKDATRDKKEQCKDATRDKKEQCKDATRDKKEQCKDATRDKKEQCKDASRDKKEQCKDATRDKQLAEKDKQTAVKDKQSTSAQKSSSKTSQSSTKKSVSSRSKQDNSKDKLSPQNTSSKDKPTLRSNDSKDKATSQGGLKEKSKSTSQSSSSKDKDTSQKKESKDKQTSQNKPSDNKKQSNQKSSNNNKTKESESKTKASELSSKSVNSKDDVRKLSTETKRSRSSRRRRVRPRKQSKEQRQSSHNPSKDNGKPPVEGLDVSTADDRWKASVEMFLQQYGLKKEAADRYSPSQLSPHHSRSRSRSRKRTRRSRSPGRRRSKSGDRKRSRSPKRKSRSPGRRSRSRRSRSFKRKSRSHGRRSRSPRRRSRSSRRRSRSPSFSLRRPSIRSRSRSRSSRSPGPSFLSRLDFIERELYSSDFGHRRSPSLLGRRGSRSPIGRRRSRSPFERRRSRSRLGRRRSRSPFGRRHSRSPFGRRMSRSPPPIGPRRCGSRSPARHDRSLSPKRDGPPPRWNWDRQITLGDHAVENHWPRRSQSRERKLSGGEVGIEPGPSESRERLASPGVEAHRITEPLKLYHSPGKPPRTSYINFNRGGRVNSPGRFQSPLQPNIYPPFFPGPPPPFLPGPPPHRDPEFDFNGGVWQDEVDKPYQDW